MLKKKMTLSLLASALICGSIIAGQPTVSAAGQEGIIEKSVNFREKPSLSGDRIRYLKAGEHVDILEQVNQYWFKIKDLRGQTGYVTTQSQFIKTNGSVTDKPAEPVSGTPKSIIDAGMKYLGTPYVFGSSRSNTQTFDCSDFVRQAFKDGAGVILPGNSRTQAAYVKKIGATTTNWRELHPGDIMFFMSYEGSKSSDYSGINKSSQRITHNGIYLGNGKILHTYSEKSGGVRIDQIEGKHWEYRFVFGGSAIK
ncbi:C40 family peptidase [Paenibacillus glucanolyticus]|uniref:C40 family peptidase n=2 Tax=Paenibacillus TaxID=44249 RepID=A0A9X1XXL6_9BACL|nr:MULTISPECIES: SH3 domain-containing C40 family peptidase [Paenibacillaceae]MCK8487455.1 C40 family peptidase [Paenibacillus mellifer]MCT1400902.1 C40 family peptidase [Paenibacillus sp. p3-SID867]